jgi:hypothetical protein
MASEGGGARRGGLGCVVGLFVVLAGAGIGWVVGDAVADREPALHRSFMTVDLAADDPAAPDRDARFRRNLAVLEDGYPLRLLASRRARKEEGDAGKILAELLEGYRIAREGDSSLVRIEFEHPDPAVPPQVLSELWAAFRSLGHEWEDRAASALRSERDQARQACRDARERSAELLASHGYSRRSFEVHQGFLREEAERLRDLDRVRPGAAPSLPEAEPLRSALEAEQRRAVREAEQLRVAREELDRRIREFEVIENRVDAADAETRRAEERLAALEAAWAEQRERLEDDARDGVIVTPAWLAVRIRDAGIPPAVPGAALGAIVALAACLAYRSRRTTSSTTP